MNSHRVTYFASIADQRHHSFSLKMEKEGLVGGSHFETWGVKRAAGSNLWLGWRDAFERFLKKVRWWVMGSLPSSGWTYGAAIHN